MSGIRALPWKVFFFPRKRTASPASSLPASSLRRTETAFGTIRKIFSATPMAAQAGSLCALPRGRKQTFMTEGFPRKRGAAAGTYAPAACFSENSSAPFGKGACQNFCSLPGSFLPRAGFCLRHGGTEKGISPEPGASDSFLAFGARYAREIPACPAGRREDARLFFSRFRSGKGERGRFFPCSVVLRSEKRGGSIFFRRSRPVLPSAPAMFFSGVQKFFSPSAPLFRRRGGRSKKNTDFAPFSGEKTGGKNITCCFYM